MDNRLKDRVLFVHNHYRSSAPSGENHVVRMEKDMLQRHGVKVGRFFRQSDDLELDGTWGKIKGACSTPWNPFTYRQIRMKLEEFKPDVVHVHNTFPSISPAVFYAVGKRAARVLTLHNYRLFCSAATPIRNNKVCTKCIEHRSALPALRYGCYRESHLATLPIAVSQSLHRSLGTWARQVDAFVVLSEFQRNLVIAAGIPSDLVYVKPNFRPTPNRVMRWRQRNPNALYVGRLSNEKGVESLINAWLKWGPEAPRLRIVGDGDLRGRIESLAASKPEVRIELVGQLAPEQVQDEIATTRLLILPSICFEGFPMTLLEAFALGTPVAVSNLGPLPDIIGQGKCGIIFEPNNPRSLLASVKSIWNENQQLKQLGENARRLHELRYSEESNFRLVTDIYKKARETHRNRFETQVL